AAAGDFLEDFVIAEIANAPEPVVSAGGLVRANRDVADMSLVERAGNTVHVGLVGKESAELIGKIGMPAQEFVAVGVLSLIDRLQVIVQDCFQSLFTR